MAEQRLKRKLPSYSFLHKLFAGVSLLVFIIIIVAGVRAEVEVTTIAYRAALVMVVIGVLSRIILKVLITYEEMNSGEG